MPLGAPPRPPTHPAGQPAVLSCSPPLPRLINHHGLKTKILDSPPFCDIYILYCVYPPHAKNKPTHPRHTLTPHYRSRREEETGETAQRCAHAPPRHAPPPRTKVREIKKQRLWWTSALHGWERARKKAPGFTLNFPSAERTTI